MCGISGIISTVPIDIIALQKMSKALKHRGPDGYGYMLYNPATGIETLLNTESLPAQNHTIGFAHRRLAIIDLTENSLQPMSDLSGKYCITYNGELYNYIELRDELKALGYAFQTSGDTEVVLKSYMAWGVDCFRKFNGMWALAILDLNNQSVILSRDRFGIKPLYITLIGKVLYFASEIKAFLSLQSFQPNKKVIDKYIATGIVDADSRTFFNNIESFPSAHFMIFNWITGQQSTKAYWEFPSKQKSTNEINTYSSLLLDAVRVHARSDVPIGICLSGGLDSSSLVYLLDKSIRDRQITCPRLHAISYISSDGKWSEKKYMKIIADAFPITMNYVNISDEQIAETIPEVIRCQDEPFGSASILAQWFVFKQAKEKGLKVMLDGQGADESLAGYVPFVSMTQQNIINKIKYLLLCGQQVPKLNNVLMDYMKCLSLPAILRHEDRNSMHFSIESRVPFLDYRLIDFVFSLADKWKIRGSTTKYILREVMRAKLPEEIRARKDKIGFKAAPSLTSNYIKSHLSSLIAVKTDYEKEYLDNKSVRDMLYNVSESPPDEFRAWRIINLKLWLRNLYEREI